MNAADWSFPPGLGEPAVVAPAGPQSGVSHVITTEAAERVDARSGRFAVHGTPADCVQIGLHRLCPDARLVLLADAQVVFVRVAGGRVTHLTLRLSGKDCKATKAR